MASFMLASTSAGSRVSVSTSGQYKSKSLGPHADWSRQSSVVLIRFSYLQLMSPLTLERGYDIVRRCMTHVQEIF